MGDFNPINSQEELDAIIKNRIERERKTTAEKYADYEDLKNASANYESKLAEMAKALEEANATIAGHSAVVEELNTKITGYETKATKIRIAKEAGLDIDFADRITGATDEEMKADAELLAKAFKTNHAPQLAISEPIITPATESEKALRQVAQQLFTN